MKILIIVENLPVPFDRRVWQEATTLKKNGHEISIICPAMKGYTKQRETIDGIQILRHPLPVEGDNALGYALEYSSSLFFQFVLSLRVLIGTGFDVIHACNPPDTIFLIGGLYKLCFGKKFLFDHHDINPELYLAKFNRKDVFYRLMLLLEKWTFKTANISIATNNSYKQIAVSRGKMKPEDVFVVRSGPDLTRTRRVAKNMKWKNGKKYLVGYVGVMGAQEGLDLLLKGAAHLVHGMKRDEIHFVLVGGGTELENLKKMSETLNIKKYITFTGRVPDQTLMEVLSTSDVCVNPDVVNEMNDKSTMNKIMEYMALGKPIVQFESTEGRFSAQDASLYAERNCPESLIEKILTIIDDPKKAKEMASIGKSRIETALQWKYEVPHLLSAYEKISGKA